MSENKRGRKVGIKTVPINETKSEKFKRLATKRLNKVLNGIRQLKNLSSTAYEYTPGQVEYIGSKISIANEDLKNSFTHTNIKIEEKIELP